MQTTETRTLPVKLTEEELATKAQELAESVANEEKLREEFAGWEDSMKQAKKAKQGRIHIAHDDTVNLGEIVETGVEEREVACTWLRTASAAYLRRDDTGSLVRVRELLDSERQAVIGETEVVQEPAMDDLTDWAFSCGFDGAEDLRGLTADEVHQDDKARMEAFIQEHFES
jgi:hypothetical protein